MFNNIFTSGANNITRQKKKKIIFLKNIDFVYIELVVLYNKSCCHFDFLFFLLTTESE